MKKLIAIAAMMIGALAMTGCSTTPQNFVASSKPILQGRYTELGTEVEGTDSMIMVLLLRWRFPCGIVFRRT